MSAMMSLTQKLLCGVEEQTFSDVVLAIENPRAYYEKYKEEFDDDDIDEPIEEMGLEWGALISALLENELAFYLKWKITGVYICDGVDELLEKKNMVEMTWDDFEDGEFDEVLTADCLNEISRRLKEKSIALASLDDGGCDYILITVPLSEIEEIKHLADEAGYRIYDEFE